MEIEFATTHQLLDEISKRSNLQYVAVCIEPMADGISDVIFNTPKQQAMKMLRLGWQYLTDN